MNKDKFVYLWDDNELEKFRNEHKGKSYEVFRYKGLGEMSRDETDILINPKHRKWVQVTVSDVDKATEFIQNLMGDDVEPRREFLSQNAAKANITI